MVNPDVHPHRCEFRPQARRPRALCVGAWPPRGGRTRGLGGCTSALVRRWHRVASSRGHKGRYCIVGCCDNKLKDDIGHLCVLIFVRVSDMYLANLVNSDHINYVGTSG